MTENCKLRKAILPAFYNILPRTFGILLILWCSFKLWWNFCLDLLSSKFWLIGEWSIVSLNFTSSSWNVCFDSIHHFDNYVTHTFWSWSIALISKLRNVIGSRFMRARLLGQMTIWPCFISPVFVQLSSTRAKYSVIRCRSTCPMT
jgi:hypothetical protein